VASLHEIGSIRLARFFRQEVMPMGA